MVKQGGEDLGQALRQEKYSEPINYLEMIHSDSKGWITKADYIYNAIVCTHNSFQL